MIWYLLSPLRGTTQPPQLSANHPVRRAFYRHGKTTAQHWLLAMLVSVAIAMASSYPTILLAGHPTAGFAAYPHHVWTTAKFHEGDPANVDVEMRQIWIHGSYMKALEKDVLRHGLEIQQNVIGAETSSFPPAGEDTSVSKLAWGYHSPLMYWNNSAEVIEADTDIVRTINEQAHRASSSMNVALRPASVFAGKRFERQKLLAADALVITLMNDAMDGAGDRWRERMASLTAGVCEHCTLFPRDGQVTHSLTYELRFTPLSFKENIALTFAYSCMAIYVLLSVRRIKAFHSRFGLVVTAITQMTCSVLASFTICGLLKINLSMIPQNAYPFVVLVIGLENMFRIINAVLAYPPTMATEIRIANALGDVGPVSVAAAAQNVLILSILSRLVSPGVAAFCAFACIATLFDAFFLLTFFVAVLNVDIRRFELQDALARANQLKHRRRPSPTHQHSWFDALVQGRLPFSTRMAGTAVTTTFILSLNYHFFEHKGKTTSLTQLLGLIKEGPPTSVDFIDSALAVPGINASLTPGQWMEMQDFDTAKEVLKLAKPGANTVVIKVFSPLLIVLPGSDRSDMGASETWSIALRSFAAHHFYPVTIAVVFAVAFVAVLMNFLLYSEVGDEARLSVEEEEELAVRSVTLPHKLDIVKLSGSGNGHLVSVGLDKSIVLSRFDRSQQIHSILPLPPEILSAIYWPIHQAAIDDSGDWAAFHCANDQVVILRCQLNSMTVNLMQYPDDSFPILFGFWRLHAQEHSELYFLTMTPAGRIAMVGERSNPIPAKLVTDLVLGAAILDIATQGKRLFVVTEQVNLISFTWSGDAWVQSSNRLLPLRMERARLTGSVTIEQHTEQGFDMLVVTTTSGAIFLGSQNLEIKGTLVFDELQHAVNKIILGATSNCHKCNSLAFRSLAFVHEASSAASEGVVTILRPTAEGNNATLCINSETSSSSGCESLKGAARTKHILHKSSASAALASQPTILGIRRRQTSSQPRGRSQASLSSSSASSSSSSSLRHRRRNTRGNSSSLQQQSQHQQTRSNNNGNNATDEDVWEAYKLSIDEASAVSATTAGGNGGETETVNVPTFDAEDDKALYVSRAGPAVVLDSQSIAVAFGNTVKIVRAAARRGSASLMRRPR